MEFVVMGDLEGGPSIFLEEKKFSYAGKFVMKDTGKIVGKIEGDIIAAASFNFDRTDKKIAWIRCISIRKDKRREGIGHNLILYITKKIVGGVPVCVRVAVNNPIAYDTFYKAGFEYTGNEVGLCELILEYPKNQTYDMYRKGAEIFENRKYRNNQIV
jgi:predicted acetyltransferase